VPKRGPLADHIPFQTEKLRLSVAVHREELQGFLFRLMKKEGSLIKGDDATNSFIGRSEKRFLSEVVYDGIVDVEKAAFPLLAHPQCLFRLFPLSNVEEGYDGADGFAIANHRMRPILDGEAGSVLSPKNVIVNMDASVLVKT